MYMYISKRECDGGRYELHKKNGFLQYYIEYYA